MSLGPQHRAWWVGGRALTRAGQVVQGTGVLGQGPQALDPAAANRGGRPGCLAQGTQLPKESRQQLSLLEAEKEVVTGPFPRGQEGKRWLSCYSGNSLTCCPQGARRRPLCS